MVGVGVGNGEDMPSERAARMPTEHRLFTIQSSKVAPWPSAGHELGSCGFKDS